MSVTHDWAIPRETFDPAVALGQAFVLKLSLAWDASDMGTTVSAKRGLVIAIDGPAGAGKSTLARELARRLQLPYVNTGLMYRTLAARSLERGIDPDDERSLARVAESIAFTLEPPPWRAAEGPVEGPPEPPRELWIDGSPPPAELTSPEVEAVVSLVARHPAVREILRREQRLLGAAGSVMEGRDIGTIVFPDADLKLFLSAAPKVRARRREQERAADEAGPAVAQRDEQDARTNPLVPAADAFSLDSTALGTDEVLRAALALVHRVVTGEDGPRARWAERK